MKLDLGAKKIRNIVVLTGAGISSESGIATFRDHNGLWENHHIEDVATPLGFQRNPKLVHEFYNQRRKQLLDPKIKPNDGHLWLARLEKEWKGTFILITQNVDNLHERAGSKNLLHMHGELLKIRCKQTGKVYAWENDLSTENICECCHIKNMLRPDIVWFNEMPKHMGDIELHLEHADLFLAIGTSGTVYPASGFVQVAKRKNNALTVEINPQETEVSPYFDLKLRSNAGVAMEEIFRTLMSL